MIVNASAFCMYSLLSYFSMDSEAPSPHIQTNTSQQPLCTQRMIVANLLDVRKLLTS